MDDAGAPAAAGADILMGGADAPAAAEGAAPPAPGPAGAPNAAAVMKAVAEKQAEEAKAATQTHYTMHGCFCEPSWEFKGATYEGCVKDPGGETKEYSWCVVQEGCTKGNLDDATGNVWDFCSPIEDESPYYSVHECHCSPLWEFNDVVYKGCAKPVASKPAWCYLHEADPKLCPEALRTEHGGQHWDQCHMPVETDAVLTKNGCHCQPEWTHKDVKYSGCVPSTPDHATPWCYTFEDSSNCPGASALETGERWDSCFLVEKEEEPAVLHPTNKGCFCMPEWEFKGETYYGCAMTFDKPRKWCFVVSDERDCGEAEGVGTDGKDWNRRWDYCDGLADLTQVAEPGAAPVPAPIMPAPAIPGGIAQPAAPPGPVVAPGSLPTYSPQQGFSSVPWQVQQQPGGFAPSPLAYTYVPPPYIPRGPTYRGNAVRSRGGVLGSFRLFDTMAMIRAPLVGRLLLFLNSVSSAVAMAQLLALVFF